MRKSTLFKHQSNYWPLLHQFVLAVQTEDFPETEQKLREVADKLTNLLELTVVNKFVHPFSPCGLTLVYVLSESHLAIHTWPERKVLHIDLVTCSELEHQKVEEAVKSIFDPESSFLEWL